MDLKAGSNSVDQSDRPEGSNPSLPFRFLSSRPTTTSSSKASQCTARAGEETTCSRSRGGYSTPPTTSSPELLATSTRTTMSTSMTCCSTKLAESPATRGTRWQRTSKALTRTRGRTEDCLSLTERWCSRSPPPKSPRLAPALIKGSCRVFFSLPDFHWHLH